MHTTNHATNWTEKSSHVITIHTRLTTGHTTYLEVEVPEAHVLGQHIQHAYHLREDEHAVTGLVESHQQLVQQVQLTTATNQSLHMYTSI